jgi:5'-nucleotidase
VPLPTGTLLNVNVPGTKPEGVDVARLGKRVYRDQLSLVEERGPGRRLYRIYGDVDSELGEQGTDLVAVAQRRIAVTPLHFALTHHESIEALAAHDLNRLLADQA